MNSLRPQRSRKTKEPCLQCGLHLRFCICSQIPHLQIKTRVVLVIHAKEIKRTTNSGRLALAALENSEQRVRGQNQEPVDLSDLLTSNYESLLFYPSEEAIELTDEFVKSLDKPVQLIVPDGSWRQASKVHTRHPELAGIKRVMITTPNTAKHHLRRESSPYGMSTLEAIARALSVLEGPDTGKMMMDLYQAKLQATLIGRGVMNDAAGDIGDDIDVSVMKKNETLDPES